MQIVIPGQPIAQGRHRMGNGIAYTPKQTRTWQGIARTAASEVMEGPPLEGPLSITVSAQFMVAQSWPAWKQEAALNGRIVPAGRPDIDNVVKNVKDALNQVVWRDDCQVVEVTARKRYSELPCVVVTVATLGAHSPSNLRKRDLDADS